MHPPITIPGTIPEDELAREATGDRTLLPEGTGQKGTGKLPVLHIQAKSQIGPHRAWPEDSGTQGGAQPSEGAKRKVVSGLCYPGSGPARGASPSPFSLTTSSHSKTKSRLKQTSQQTMRKNPVITDSALPTSFLALHSNIAATLPPHSDNWAEGREGAGVHRDRRHPIRIPGSFSQVSC